MDRRNRQCRMYMVLNSMANQSELVKDISRELLKDGNCACLCSLPHKTKW